MSALIAEKNRRVAVEHVNMNLNAQIMAHRETLAVLQHDLDAARTEAVRLRAELAHEREVACVARRVADAVRDLLAVTDPERCECQMHEPKRREA